MALLIAVGHALFGLSGNRVRVRTNTWNRQEENSPWTREETGSWYLEQ